MEVAPRVSKNLLSLGLVYIMHTETQPSNFLHRFPVWDLIHNIRISVARYLKYRVILSVLDPRTCEYLKHYSLDFEHEYMIIYLAS